MKTRLLSLLIAFLFFSEAFGQFDAATAGIQKIMEEHPVVGLSVAVVKNNQMIYVKSFGYQDFENKKPLTDSNLFRIASISKSFSATAMMQLLKEKKFSLDEDLSNLVGFTIRNPKFPETLITTRLVMSHLSSINDSEGYFTLDAINPAKNPNWAKCYNAYEPGKGYQYCNLNYNMIGTIIELLSGERFDQRIKHQILDPLNIVGGYCVDSLNKSLFANIYEYNLDSAKFYSSPAAYHPRSLEIKNYQMGYSTPIFSPTGGMKISAQGLANYMRMHMNYGKLNGHRIITKKNAKLMQTPLSDEENYGFALETSTKLIPGKTMIGHTGSAYGLFSAMYFQPEEKFGIVVISNGCDPRHSEGYNTVIRKAMICLYDTLVQ